jgi:hypothetical protein
LSKELNGTCTETRQEFFLGSAIQTPGLDEDTFSDSQMLPPINQSDMNFDDTSTGGFSPLSASSSDAAGYDFDDSVGIASEDDVAIELGDIMPIDFEQLDSDSVLAGGTLEHNESLNFDNFNFDLDKTESVSLPTDQEIDLDLTADFVESGEHFQFDGDLSDIDIGDLSQDLPVVLADGDSSPDQALSDVPDKFSEHEDFDFDPELFEQLADTSANNSFDETTSLNPDVGLNETQISFLSAGDEQLAPLDLDESLVAELAGPSSPDHSGEFSLDYSDDHSASGDFELDAALVAELASGDEVVAANSTEDIPPVTESLSADTVEFESPLEFSHGSTENEPLSFDQVEDLTGDFPSLHEEDDTVLSGLDLADIDVSDLLDPSDKVPTVAGDDGLNQPGDWSVESAPRPSSVDDTIREEGASRESDQLDIHVDDEVALEFDEELLSEDSEGLDDTTKSDLDATTGEFNIPEGNTPQDFSSSFLDDTFRDGESNDASFVASEEELADDILDEVLVLDDAAMDEDLPVDIDALALDADFEAFLNKTAKGDNLPEIELIADDDDEDGPPDLPS